MNGRISCLFRIPSSLMATLALAIAVGMTWPAIAATAHDTKQLALTPPMGWNDWAHYECSFNSQTVLSNARALVKTGLAAHGYNTVVIDDCWMQKTRDASGNLQVDPGRFPQGMKAVSDAVHGLGLKFGIYEDAGYETCGKFAGSGVPQGGGRDHFLQDAKLFASWGVDYLKLDGCNVYVPKGGSKGEAYREAYAAQQAALKATGRPIVFSESAPAYFQGTPGWYDVLTWVRDYGQLWREGTDIEVFDPKKPDANRFQDVLWNYAYNLPLGRFQTNGNWNDADFIIGGDRGMSIVETRSQVALWSMMSAPLILSSEVDKISPQAISILTNKAVIAVDQDKLGRMATLLRRSPVMDLLWKPLADGDYAVAVLDRGTGPMHVELHPSDFGFAAGAACSFDAQNLWNGTKQSGLTALRTDIASHDTGIWHIHPTASCGKAARTGTITMTAPGEYKTMDGYTRCLTTTGKIQSCAGTPDEAWSVTPTGALKSGDRCLALQGGKPVMQECSASAAQHWKYTLAGNLMGANHECLTSKASGAGQQSLIMQACGHNQLNQIWSLPN